MSLSGQFRFTPPTHAILAFRQALQELGMEGGVQSRNKRYQALQQCVVKGLETIGFETYLGESMRGPIITSFRYPNSPNWDFDIFYQKLSDRGSVSIVHALLHLLRL